MDHITERLPASVIEAGWHDLDPCGSRGHRSTASHDPLQSLGRILGLPGPVSANVAACGPVSYTSGMHPLGHSARRTLQAFPHSGVGTSGGRSAPKNSMIRLLTYVKWVSEE